MKLYKYRKIFLVMSAAIVLLWVCFLCMREQADQELVINEVCSNNYSIATDESQAYADYIELYNGSFFECVLNGYTISDGKNRMSLDGYCIPARGYAVITNLTFGISSAGETISLYNAEGQCIDSITIPGLEQDTVYAREVDKSDNWVVEEGTPGRPNAIADMIVQRPVFSEESGFYEEEFKLTIACHEGEKVYYTLDGSIPDTNSLKYEDGIQIKNVCREPNRYSSVQQIDREWLNYEPPQEPVDKAMVVRALAVNGYGKCSAVVTKVYFVDMPAYEDQYVISLVSDPDALFGDDGIYVTGKEYDDWYLGDQEGEAPEANYLQHGRDYEIPSSITLFRGKVLLEQEAGIRIQGASSREAARKNFSVYARKEYSGSRYFSYDFFGEGKTHSFLLRSGFEDAVMQSLARDRDVETQQVIPVTVFLDGEKWNDTYIKEKYSEDFYAQKYNVDRANVLVQDGVPQEIYDFLNTHGDLSDSESYSQIGSLMDIQNYIDYYCTNIYLCNMDLHERKNCKTWKITDNTGKEPMDAKWRWSLYDMDASAWGKGQGLAQIDSFSEKMQFCGDNTYNNQTLYVALKANAVFRKQFVLSFMDIANTNFSEREVAARLEKWGVDMDWNSSFFKERFQYIVPALAREFNLQGTLEEITLKVSDENAGYVMINTAEPTLEKGQWQGNYYTDYPVQIKAIAYPGYEFGYWTDGEKTYTEEETEVELKKGGCSFAAVFTEKR